MKVYTVCFVLAFMLDMTIARYLLVKIADNDNPKNKWTLNTGKCDELLIFSKPLKVFPVNPCFIHVNIFLNIDKKRNQKTKVEQNNDKQDMLNGGLFRSGDKLTGINNLVNRAFRILVGSRPLGRAKGKINNANVNVRTLQYFSNLY